MKVSVVVSTFNRREIVLRSVQTLIDQDFPPEQYDLGVRALQVQRGIHYYRRVLEIERRPAPGTGERK
jgi:hypothetical protein